MKFKFKRLLALLLAIMLAIPSFAFAEDAALVLDVEPASEVAVEGLDVDLDIEDLGNQTEEAPPLELDDALESGALLANEGEGEQPAAPAFSKALELDGLRFAVSADAGVVGEGAELNVTWLNYAAEVADAAKAIGVDGVHAVYGIYLTGGGALLRGLDKRLKDKININFHIAEDPLHSVAKGAGIALKNVDRFSFLMR